MTGKHTPGPWIACPGDARNHYNIETRNSGNDLHPVATLIGPDRLENARLISAAPELAEAILEMLAVFGDHEQYDEESAAVVSAARAAIAKATGETP